MTILEDQPAKSFFILYVEDNQNDVLLLKTGFKLRHFHFDMQIACDGVEALAFLRSHERKPDIILLDLNLPKKSGYEVLQEVKHDTNLNSIRVIVYSGSANKKDAEKCIKMGASEFLEKPSNMEGILKVVDRLKQVIVN
jgi:chemotaxis family two-component system response regulator Rcp1